MKKILITGANSYVGTSVEAYLRRWHEKYSIDTLDMTDAEWEKKSFSDYDVVFHVAGIAHVDVKKASEMQKQLYYDINTSLTIKTAQKAKNEGVVQFIFMSSAIVYGDSAPIGKDKVITKDTITCPANFYGDSKLQAENGILPLNSDSFHVVVLRPPMIYGKGSKGNYPLLSKMARKLPFFPRVSNARSMIYIGNFTRFVRLMIDNWEEGIFWPQNEEYSNTSEVVRMIAKVKGKEMKLLGGVTWLLKILSHFTGLVDKAFGNLTYDHELSVYKEKYCLFSLEESIILTENE